MAALNDHSQRAHAILSASSSSRWLACPPSAVAATLYPNTSTDYTREGTLAHEIAEMMARTSLECRNVSHFPLPDVPAEMIHCAEAYRDYIWEQIHDDNAVILLEQRVDFSPWVPDGFGTADCIIIQGNRLDVIDYKYGQGVAVSAVDNTQMRLYGLGAFNDFGDIYDIHEVGMHIFQPRLNNVSVEALHASDLEAWGEWVKPIAAQAAAGKGDACAGEHCRFCPHAGNCPTLAAVCMKVANTHGGKATVPTLAPWMVADILKQEPMISAWLKAVKDRALTQMLNGEEIPGYKVVEGRGSRAWSDDLNVTQTLFDAGYHPMDYMSQPELLSPAALEKALGKKKVAELVGSLIVSKPGSPTVAPAADKRKPFDRLAEARKDFE